MKLLLIWLTLLALAAPAAAGQTAPAPAPDQTRSIGTAGREDAFLLSAGGTDVSLSRGSLLWGSERVTLDGRPLVAGRDYTLEYQRGGLHLIHPAKSGSILVIRFVAPPILAPAAEASSGTSSPRPSLIKQRLARLLDGPQFGPQEATNRPEGKPQSGEAMRDELLAGLRLTQLQDQFRGEGRDAGSYSYFRAEAIDPETASAGREEFSSNLDLHPNSAGRLRLLNFISRESLFTDDYQEQERHRLQFDQTFGKSTASLLWDRTRSDGRGAANALDALSLTLTRPFGSSTRVEGYFSAENSLYRGNATSSLVSIHQSLGQALQAQAGLQFRTSDLTGNAVDTGLTLSSQPVKGTDLNFSLQQADTDRYGRYQKLSTDLTAALSSRFQIQGELTRRTSDQYGAIDSLGLGFAARPSTRSLLEAAFSQSTGQALGRETSDTVRLSLDPTQALRVQLGYDLSQSSRDGMSQNALWLVTMGGKRYVKLEGYASLHDPKNQAPFQDSLYRVEVRPWTPFALSAQLRRVLLEEKDRSVAGVGAELRLLRLFEVSAAYRKPTPVGPLDPALPGQDLRLSFLPVGGLRVFGQYTVRPEDERGGLLDQINRSLGVETTLGSFSLQGTYTSMQGLLVTEPGRQLDFLASLKVRGGTKLYGGIRTQDPIALDQQRSRIYRVGVSQTAGAAFVLLEGQFGWLVDAAGASSWSSQDTLAQARVGLRF